MPNRTGQARLDMSKDTHLHDAPGGYYAAPQKVSTWESFKKFLYNRETGQILGRTVSSWGKIGAFYLIFYSVLASMFGIMLWIFYHTLDPRVPRWTLTQSLIGKHPGLGFRPMPNDTDGRSTLIWYKGKDPRTFQLYIKRLDKFLDVYRRPGLTPGRGQNIYNCDYDRPPGRGQVCDVDVKNWHPCISENQFNYHKSGPCVFIKLNKIYGWHPEFYNDTSNLPANMPDDLKAHIKQQRSLNPLLLNTIWVTCEGEHPLDKENIGEIRYIPKQGFPGFFYPFINTEGYLSPLVAIHFMRPRTGVIINVECKAWARNLIHDRKEKVGVVHFELLID